MSVPVPRNPANDRLSQLLSVSVAVAQASGGAIWLTTEDGQPIFVTQQGLGEQRIDQLQANWPGHAEQLTDVLSSGTVASLQARFELNAGEAQKLQLLLIPIREDSRIGGVLELFLPQRETPSQATTIAHVEQVLELLLDTESAKRASDFAKWLSQIHQSLNVSKTCFSLANDTRTWSKWDRVSCLVVRGKRTVVQAISGLDTFDRRSGAVRELEALLATSEPTERAIDDYAKRVKATVVRVLPLKTESHGLIGQLVFENFHENTNAQPLSHLSLIQSPASTALQNALTHQRAQSNILTRTVRSIVSYSFGKLVLGLGLVFGAVAALCLIQTDLTISGTGVLQPERRQDLFANTNGIVETLHVMHGQQIGKGDPLITLRSPELEFELKRIDGERNTVQQQITDLETLTSDPRRLAEGGTSPAELAARIEELKSTQQGLEAQLDILKLQEQELVIVSPISGDVLTWDIDGLLEDRPVSRTDRLLTVAQLDGPWVLNLQIDHRDIGPVTEAFQDESATVTFVTANDTEHAKPATLIDVAPALTLDVAQGPVLELVATVDKDQLPDIQPGTTVIPKITCGRAPIGYVWFSRLIDRVHAWWALW